jgi:hypothetical protein
VTIMIIVFLTTPVNNKTSTNLFASIFYKLRYKINQSIGRIPPTPKNNKNKPRK